MAARPRTRSAVPESKHHQNDETEPLTAFERQREQRIRENKARIGEFAWRGASGYQDVTLPMLLLIMTLTDLHVLLDQMAHITCDMVCEGPAKFSW